MKKLIFIFLFIPVALFSQTVNFDAANIKRHAAPLITIDKLYNFSGGLYFNGINLSDTGRYIQVFNYKDFKNGTFISSDRLNVSALRIHNSLASVKFITQSDTIKIKANPQLDTLRWNEIRITINGVAQYLNIADSSTEYSVPLGTGSKVVELTESGESAIGYTIKGCFLTSIKVKYPSSNYIPIKTIPADDYLFLGNSITSGGNATHMQQGFPMLFRDAGFHTSVLGYGYAMVAYFSHDPNRHLHGKVDTLAKYAKRLLRGTNSNTIIIELGTNDYGGLFGSYGGYSEDSTLFRHYCDTILKALHAQLPAVKIFWITPLIRSYEGKNCNGYGHTLNYFRNEIDSACLNKPYVQVIEGRPILDLADLDGGLELSTAGHVKLYNYLKNIIRVRPSATSIADTTTKKIEQ